LATGLPNVHANDVTVGVPGADAVDVEQVQRELPIGDDARG